MIRIKVFAPFFCHCKQLDERGWLTVKDDGVTLGKVMRILKLPKVLAKIMCVTVNGIRQPMNTVMKDGDVIGFFAFVAGG